MGVSAAVHLHPAAGQESLSQAPASTLDPRFGGAYGEPELSGQPALAHPLQVDQAQGFLVLLGNDSIMGRKHDASSAATRGSACFWANSWGSSRKRRSGVCRLQ